MNQTFELLGNVGEFVGAMAVVVTLIYLAIQLKQNSQQVRLNSSQLATNTYTGKIIDVLSDVDKLDLFRRGLQSYDDLPKDDQARFHALMMGFQTTYMQNLQLYHEGVLSEEAFSEWERDWMRILKCPGSEQWWRLVNPLIDDVVVALIEQKVSQSDQHALNEVMPFLRPEPDNG